MSTQTFDRLTRYIPDTKISAKIFACSFTTVSKWLSLTQGHGKGVKGDAIQVAPRGTGPSALEKLRLRACSHLAFFFFSQRYFYIVFLCSRALLENAPGVFLNASLGAFFSRTER